MLPPFSEHATALQPGIYQHYSGKQYEVLGVARHSESLEELVIYRALYPPHDFWVRPLGMFLEHIIYNGQLISRFSYKSER